MLHFSHSSSNWFLPAHLQYMLRRSNPNDQHNNPFEASVALPSAPHKMLSDLAVAGKKHFSGSIKSFLLFRVPCLHLQDREAPSPSCYGKRGPHGYFPQRSLSSTPKSHTCKYYLFIYACFTFYKLKITFRLCLVCKLYTVFFLSRT